jgi:hypothetical protein
MFTVFNESLGEVLSKKRKMHTAVKDAVEWAEWDDICVQVRDRKGNVCFEVDGAAQATEYLGNA